MPSQIFSVGHSNRSLAVLLELLAGQEIAALADVRRYPASRRLPHFGKDLLEPEIVAAGIAYVHLPDLGGMREARADSPNLGLKDAALRGYADHMSTPAFRAAVDRLLALPSPAAFMCAEALPEHCHRSLLSDELMRRGITVRHIVDSHSPRAHVLHPLAVDAGGQLIYPSPTPDQLRLPLGGSAL